MNELPKGWVITKLENLAADQEYPIGDGDHGQIKPSDYGTSGIPYIRVGDMGWGTLSKEKMVFISKETHKNNSKSKLVPGDILIAKTGATIGKCCIVPDEFVEANTTSSVGKVSINPKLTTSKWILYYFLSKEFYDYIWSISERTAQPGFNNRDLKIFSIPLAPLNEQKRIVKKLDKLLAGVEEAKARLEKIPVIIKRFRQSVLNAAVTGELTKDWRERNGISNKWIPYLLNEVCHSISDGDHLPPPQVKNGIPFLVISNIVTGKLDFESVTRYVPKDYYNNLKRIRIPEIGDVLYSVTGSIGIPVLVNVNRAFCFQRHIAILRPNEKIISNYLFYFLQSALALNQGLKFATGIAQLTIPLRGLRSYKLAIPSIEEQKEIVKRVEALFKKADEIEERYKKAKAYVDKLTQSILAKAFRGELVPQDPNDPPAGELLEKIKLEKEKLNNNKKQKKERRAGEPAEKLLERVREEREKFKDGKLIKNKGRKKK